MSPDQSCDKLHITKIRHEWKVQERHRLGQLREFVAINLPKLRKMPVQSLHSKHISRTIGPQLKFQEASKRMAAAGLALMKELNSSLVRCSIAHRLTKGLS